MIFSILDRIEKKTRDFLAKKFHAKSIVIDEVRKVGISPLEQVVVRGTFQSGKVKRKFKIEYAYSWFYPQMTSWQLDDLEN
jgi:hypothetical protein